MKRTPLGRSTPLQRAARLTRRAITASRPKVTAAERAARKVVRVRSGQVCEVCGRHRAENMHHRRKAGRVWTPENLLHVCGWGNATGCHGYIERNPTTSRQQGWIVPSHRDPATVPLWLAGRGYVVLAADGGIHEAPEQESA